MGEEEEKGEEMQAKVVVMGERPKEVEGVAEALEGVEAAADSQPQMTR